MSENIKEIIEKIEYNYGEFPKKELNILIENQAEATPYLLDSLRDPKECFEKLWDDERSYMLPYYAFYLLAQFRETHAYPLVYDIFSYDADTVDETFGDFTTEDLGRILASVSGGDVSLLKKLLENEDAYEFVRTATFDSWMCLLKAGKVKRAELIEYLKYLLQKDWEEESHICSSAALACLDIKALELLPLVEKKYQNNEIDLMFLGDWNFFKKEIVTQTRDRLDANSKYYNLVDDTISELKSWNYSIEEIEPAKSVENTETVSAEPTFKQNQIAWDSDYDGTFVREIPKVGNNEPCPCGSEVKYKKCCMNS